jgi:hypothetical protein
MTVQESKSAVGMESRKSVVTASGVHSSSSGMTWGAVSSAGAVVLTVVPAAEVDVAERSSGAERSGVDESNGVDESGGPVWGRVVGGAGSSGGDLSSMS